MRRSEQLLVVKGPSESGRCGLRFLLALLLALVVIAAAVFFALRRVNFNPERTQRVLAWLRAPGQYPQWAIQAGQRCEGAVFIFPTDGYIGFLWGDSFRLGHTHQGLDIFGGEEVNLTPVVAAYPGYLTRMPDWKSSVIIRIPQDPLDPTRQIWTYYTHMAGPDGESFVAPEFPRGTQELYVDAGTLLGYQGNYSGDPGNPVGVHLHFSIVKDNGQGGYLNELEFDNTLDPSPYFGLPLNAADNQGQIPICPD